MAGPIVIEYDLKPRALDEAARQVRRAFQSVIDTAVNDARVAAQRVRETIGAAQGSRTANGAEQQRAREIEAIARHQQRINEIEARAAAQSRVIEQRRQAQLDVLRERAIQEEIRRQERLNRATQSGGFLGFLRRYSSTIREAGESLQQSAFVFLQFTGLILDVGRAAVRSAIQIDQQVNTLRALTGSAEAAEARFRSLFELAQRTPGLTTNLALTLDAQLRAASVSQQTIDKILPAIGRINAVSPLGDPQKFAQNLVQLITQGFERTDLKELVGQSPIAGTIIRQVFNVDNPTNAKAIRESAQKLGIRTTEQFFAAFATAAQNSPALANVTESLGTRLEKLQDRISVALRPLGVRILEIIAPALEKIVPLIEGLFERFGRLSPTVQTAIVAVGGLAVALGPLAIGIGAVIQAFGALGNLTVIAASMQAVATGATTAATATAAAGAAATTTGGAFAGLLNPALLAVVGLIGAAAFAWNKYGVNATAAAETTRDAQSALSQLDGAGQSLTKTLGDTFNVKLLSDFDGAMRDTAEEVAFLKDAFELLGATAVGALQSIAIFIEGSLQNVLGLFGISIDALDRDVARLGSSLGSVGERLKQGFANFKATADANEVRRLLKSATPEDAARARLFLGDTFDLPDSQRDTRDLPASPRTGSGGGSRTGGGSAAAKRADEEAKRIADARESLIRSAAQNEIKILEDQNRRMIELFEERKDAGINSTREFFQVRQQLLAQGLDAELKGLLRHEKVLRSQAGDARGADRVRLEEQINDVLTQQALKRNEIFGLVAKTTKEFREALKLPLLPDVSQQLEEPSSPTPQIILDARGKLLDLQQRGAQFQRLDNELRVEEQRIQNAITLGVLDEVEGRRALLGVQAQAREQLLAALAAQRELAEIDGDFTKVAQIDLQVEQIRLLGVELTNAQRFMRGFGAEAESVGDIFERFGNNVANSFRNVKSLFDGLKNAVKQFFADLLGSSLQRLTRNVLGSIFGAFQGGQGGQQQGGGGFSLGNILGGVAGSAFNTPQFNPNAGGQNGLGTALGSIFSRGGGGFVTPPFNPGGSSFNLNSLFGSLFSGGLSAPASISLPGVGNLPGVTIFNARISGPPGAGRQGILGSLFGGLGNLFSGIGFGRAPGSGGALASALPLLGLSLGSGLGGQSLLGKILGGAGGLLAGIGLTAAPASLGALSFLAPLFSNPVTAIIGAALLPAALLLGRAKQRRADERTSGDALQDAINQIRDLKKGVDTDQVDGQTAKGTFEREILGAFISVINQIKTKSVRESRLKNQVADLRALFEKEVIPAINAQELRRRTGARLVPEFAFGGVVPGIDRGYDNVLALLTPREMVLTREHQRAIQMIAGPDVFQRVGVPEAPRDTVNGAPAFASGGVVPSRASAPIIVQLGDITLNLTEEEAERIVFSGLSRSDGGQVFARAHNRARRNREIR